MDNKRFFQVYQCHAPSGGMSAVDETQYQTLEEARGAAEAMAMRVSEFHTHQIGKKKYTYPVFWAQPIDVVDGMYYVWMDTKKTLD